MRGCMVVTMDAPLEPFRDEQQHGVGRRGLGQRAIEAPSASRATIWVANPARLHGFCPCGEQPGGGEARSDAVGFAAEVMSRMIVKPLSIM